MKSHAGRYQVDASHGTLAQPAAVGAAAAPSGGNSGHVANAIAMKGEPVDEDWIREQLTLYASCSPSQHPQAF